MLEEWRGVIGFESLYEVSSLGRVRSLTRPQKHYTGKLLVRHGRELRGCITDRGYIKVSLCKDGRVLGRHVHALVAAAFIGPRPKGLLVRHLDGDGTNNAAQNLAYGTGAENAEDMRRHGTLRVGEAHGSSKLTEAQVRALRAEPAHLPASALTEKYGIGLSQVYNVRSGNHWRHVAKD